MTNPYLPSSSPMIEPPRAEPPSDRRLPFSGWWPVGCGAIAGLLLRLVYSGHARRGVFRDVELVHRGLAAAGRRRDRLRRRAQGAAYLDLLLRARRLSATVLYVVGSLALLIEGWICAILIIPVFALLGGLAGLAMGAFCRMTNWPRPSVVSCIALLPLLGGAFEHHVPNRRSRAHADTRDIRRRAARAVWRELVDTRDIDPAKSNPRGCIASGCRCRPRARAISATASICATSRWGGRALRPGAVEWRENQRVSWRYRFEKDSFPPGALDDHVRIGGEYFDLGETTYELTTRGRRHAPHRAHALSREHAFQLVRGPGGGFPGRRFRGKNPAISMLAARRRDSDRGVAVTDVRRRPASGAARQLHGHLVVERLAHERPRQRRIHADVARRHVEFVRAHDAVTDCLPSASSRVTQAPKYTRLRSLGGLSTTVMPSSRFRRKRTRRSISRRRLFP